MTPDEARRLAEEARKLFGVPSLFLALLKPEDPWAEFRRKFKLN